jgi:hypothetical protein
MFLSFLDLIEDKANIENYLMLLLLHAQKQFSGMVNCLPDSTASSHFIHLDEFILQQSSLSLSTLFFSSGVSVPSLKSTPNIDSSNSSSSSGSSGTIQSTGNERMIHRQAVLLKWTYDYLICSGGSSGKNNTISKSNLKSNLLFRFPVEFIESFFRCFPFISLLQSKHPLLIQMTKKIIQTLFSFLRRLNEQSNKNSSITAHTSHASLSIHFNLLISFLSSYISLRDTSSASSFSERTIDEFLPFIESFQQNQVLATFILKQIMILFQQFSHYQQFFAQQPTSSSSAPLSRSSSSMSVSSSSDENENGNLGRKLKRNSSGEEIKNNKNVLVSGGGGPRFAVHILQKMLNILSSQDILIQLFQCHQLPNSVKMILLKLFVSFTTSVKVFLDEYHNEVAELSFSPNATSPSSPRSVDDRISNKSVLLLCIMKLLIKLSTTYTELFFRNGKNFSPENQQVRTIYFMLFQFFFSDNLYFFLFKDFISRNYSAGSSFPTSAFPKPREESIGNFFLFSDHSPFPTDSRKT